MYRRARCHMNCSRGVRVGCVVFCTRHRVGCRCGKSGADAGSQVQMRERALMDPLGETGPARYATASAAIPPPLAGEDPLAGPAGASDDHRAAGDPMTIAPREKGSSADRMASTRRSPLDMLANGGNSRPGS